jgi:hypothetical protein
VNDTDIEPRRHCLMYASLSRDAARRTSNTRGIYPHRWSWLGNGMQALVPRRPDPQICRADRGAISISRECKVLRCRWDACGSSGGSRAILRTAHNLLPE